MRALKGLAVGFLLLLAGSGARAEGPPRERETEDDLSRIQGNWQLVYAETGGKPAPAERTQSVRVVIEKNTHSVWFGDQRVAHDVSFVIDPTASPKTTDDTLNDGENKGKQVHGIYELDGDTLISCVSPLGKDRPTSFEPSPGSDWTMRVFRRIRANEDPREKAFREELIRFGGTWKFQSIESEGKALPLAPFAKLSLVLRGDRHALVGGEIETKGCFRLDPMASPKTIDIPVEEGPDKGKVIRGIYKLEGDTYTACVGKAGQDRPKAFEAPAGSGLILEVLQRQAPKE